MLREFLRRGPELCGLTGNEAARISRSILNDFDYELKNPEGAFKFIPGEDFLLRMEHLFLFKHMKNSNTAKVNHFEKQVNHLALCSYKRKYKTDEFDGPIATLEAELIATPEAELDKAMTLEASAQGYWT